MEPDPDAPVLMKNLVRKSLWAVSNQVSDQSGWWRGRRQQVQNRELGLQICVPERV